MHYIIAFDVVALLLCGTIGFSNVIAKGYRIKRNSAFKVAILLLVGAIIFEIFAVLSESDILWANDEANLVFETGYLCLGLYALYGTLLAMSSRVKYDSRSTSRVIFIMITIYTFVLLLNIPTRLVFSIVDGIYEKTFLFYATYSIPIFVMVHTVIILVRNRKNLEKRMYIAMLFASSCPIAGVLIQFFAEKIILIQFGLSITLLVLNFIWETSDAKRLEEAAQQLEVISRIEEASRKEVELADRAKTRFLEGISSELVSPIEEIQAYAKEIIEADADAEVTKDAEEIINAGEHFKELVKQISK